MISEYFCLTHTHNLKIIHPKKKHCLTNKSENLCNLLMWMSIYTLTVCLTRLTHTTKQVCGFTQHIQYVKISWLLDPFTFIIQRYPKDLNSDIHSKIH